MAVANAISVYNSHMADLAPFGVQAELRRHFEREHQTQLGIVLRQLLRSDADRLDYFDGSRVEDDFRVQRRFVPGEAERVCIEAAQNDADLTPCFGYLLADDKSRPMATAWLLRNSDNSIIDPGRGQHPFIGALGVALKATEAGNWTPHTPGAVAESNVSRLAIR